MKYGYARYYANGVLEIYEIYFFKLKYY